MHKRDDPLVARCSRPAPASRDAASFRNWKRPHVKVGGVYRLRPTGAVKVMRLGSIRVSEIGPDDVARAGFASASALAAFLGLPRTAEVTRVEFALTDDAVEPPPSPTPTEVRARLAVTDRRGASPWTARVLALIEAHPARRAGDLAPALGWDVPKFKANVRKLKALGLTQSLEVGYRLTDLGVRVVDVRASGSVRIRR